MPPPRDAPGYTLVTVQSGARSVRSLECGETFHPVIGPMQEAVALHVQGPRLIERARASRGPFIIWDVGLGAAANAIAALEALDDLPVEIHSFDRTRAPLAFARTVAAELEYLAPWTHAVDALLTHDEWQAAGKGVRWIAHWGDFRECMARAPAPSAVLYDPYSPRANPELWTLEHFTALRATIGEDAECLLTNYTRSTAVRVTLLLAGFFVGRGAATGEKDQTTVAANRPALLDDPLDVAWLARVSRSTRGAPLRSGAAEGTRIGAEDWERLLGHRQFAKSE
jgi:hypothetical protein